jgi:hypothetical protein
MKRSTLDFLTVIILAATALVWMYFLVLFLNPTSALNPLAPPTLPPRLFIPSSTPTQRRLPPSWTPGDGPVLVDTVEMQATSTLPLTDTPVVRSSFTITPTWTNTPTITPTITLTPTITRTPTRTATKNFTATELSRNATSIAKTEAAE